MNNKPLMDEPAVIEAKIKWLEPAGKKKDRRKKMLHSIMLGKIRRAEEMDRLNEMDESEKKSYRNKKRKERKKVATGYNKMRKELGEKG